MVTQQGPSKVPTQWATVNPVPVGWMRQFRYMAELYDKIRDIPGDVVECGLGEGNTFAMLAYLAGSENAGRKLWGFDSFEGWPEPTEFDKSPRDPHKGEWKVSEEMVKRRLEESGLIREYPRLKIEITKGFLGETLQFPGTVQIALLHLDVDLYAGYRDGLEYLFPKVVVGGLVLFDEYKEFPPDYNGIEKWPGCTKAVDDYFRGCPERIQYDAEAKKYWLQKVS